MTDKIKRTEISKVNIDQDDFVDFELDYLENEDNSTSQINDQQVESSVIQEHIPIPENIYTSNIMNTSSKEAAKPQTVSPLKSFSLVDDSSLINDTPQKDESVQISPMKPSPQTSAAQLINTDLTTINEITDLQISKASPNMNLVTKISSIEEQSNITNKFSISPLSQQQ